MKESRCRREEKGPQRNFLKKRVVAPFFSAFVRRRVRRRDYALPFEGGKCLDHMSDTYESIIVCHQSRDYTYYGSNFCLRMKAFLSTGECNGEAKYSADRFVRGTLPWQNQASQETGIDEQTKNLARC